MMRISAGVRPPFGAIPSVGVVQLRQRPDLVAAIGERLHERVSLIGVVVPFLVQCVLQPGGTRQGNLEPGFREVAQVDSANGVGTIAGIGGFSGPLGLVDVAGGNGHFDGGARVVFLDEGDFETWHGFLLVSPMISDSGRREKPR